MDTLQLTGYGLSIAGLATIAFSKNIISLLPFLKAMPKGELYTILGGFVLIAGGIALVLSGESSSKYNVKHAAEQVPIYEGEGKKRRIVGYQKAQ
jgi:hypothetical protein